MSLRIFSVSLLSLLILGCGSQVLNTKDITDLLEGDGKTPAASSAGNSSQDANVQSGTSSTGSQNLDYYGLTGSPTGTNTYGAVGSPGSLDR
ncbi:hypothetical protein LPTSP3_g29660 [Leptospira kobayashii]|uniref:Lipoprotein n=1 Tax=Leptospira kobayashii TaxID=1917830 RepID=A0ABN6KJC9_9LEPT|nr:hypothetical protein [Leptospira kobayashii]BDA80036.1 hypothetical protein LPTSP3_g29660 [Leptospira kobayashii]